MKRLLFVLTVIAICSCSNSSQNSSSSGAKADQKQIVITNDMENAAAMVPSWINEVTVVKMENGKAHSGDFVSKVDDKILYTYAYREYFQNISENLPKRVVVNGWVSSPDPSDNLGMVMDINENNVLKIWKSYSLSKTVVAPNKWFEFTAYFPIDQPIKPNYQVKLYGFSGKKLAYFDDFKITFEY